MSTEEAFGKVLEMIEGTNCIVLMDSHDRKKLYVARSLGSLFIGMMDDGYIVASEIDAFKNYT